MKKLICLGVVVCLFVACGEDIDVSQYVEGEIAQIKEAVLDDPENGRVRSFIVTTKFPNQVYFIFWGTHEYDRCEGIERHISVNSLFECVPLSIVVQGEKVVKIECEDDRDFTIRWR